MTARAHRTGVVTGLLGSAAAALVLVLAPASGALAAHTAVVIQVGVKQVSCTANSPNYTITSVPLRWSALGVHHEWDMPLSIAAFDKPIMLCPPKAVFTHPEN